MSSDLESRSHHHSQLIVEGIRQAMVAVVEEEFDKAKQAAIEKIELKRAEVVSGTTLRMMKMIDYQVATDRIIITIQVPK